ncbi:PD-(D/E)XK nuclease-like domain-containing protein [Companilactobacillus mishanensis]|uniref:PD-(D/E)XK nuclease-like domain-containing protein n=1 Tax=Companilactobacillus mishanensis TaxID=2486008 RepID=UPI0012971A4E|nr:PD-(D/E)XK nuclease-like domain-containing protein [Companilactobacillus mishanensis]MQS88258.1 hypothetical protein [Companilactobacillus mishanensis]
MSQNKLTKLTSKNYYDKSTDIEYQSATFFKKFLKCEAETMAELNGTYEGDMNQKALLVGNYLHSYFESPAAHKSFIDEHDDQIHKSNGDLYSEYITAESMIATLADDSGFNNFYQGKKEVIVTGQLGGVDWKGKIDCLNLDRKYFIDLKTTREIRRPIWNNEKQQKESFVAAYNYQFQMYVYQQLIYQQYGVLCQPQIIAVSKQDPPAKQVISIPPERLLEAKELLNDRQERIEELRSGLAKPNRCEECAYCRSTAKLGSIVSMDDLVS